MSTYALVQNGVVTYIGAIPPKFRNITGFNKINDDVVYKTYGFYPYEYIQPAYDGLTQALGKTVMDIQADKVVGTRQIVNKTTTDINTSKAAMYEACLDSLRGLLYATDWVHLPDSGLTPEQLAAYVAFRASINNVVNNQLGKNASIVQMGAFRIKVENSKEKSLDRKAVIPTVFVNLKTTLDALAG